MLHYCIFLLLITSKYYEFKVLHVCFTLPFRVPEFVKEKRFHNWLKDARDWAVSRNRFWGTPMPLWVSDDFEEVRLV